MTQLKRFIAMFLKKKKREREKRLKGQKRRSKVYLRKKEKSSPHVQFTPAKYACADTHTYTHSTLTA